MDEHTAAAKSECEPVTIWPCSAAGQPQAGSEDASDCFWSDGGCGYKFLDQLRLARAKSTPIAAECEESGTGMCRKGSALEHLEPASMREAREHDGAQRVQLSLSVGGWSVRVPQQAGAMGSVAHVEREGQCLEGLALAVVSVSTAALCAPQTEHACLAPELEVSTGQCTGRSCPGTLSRGKQRTEAASLSLSWLRAASTCGPSCCLRGCRLWFGVRLRSPIPRNATITVEGLATWDRGARACSRVGRLAARFPGHTAAA
eukprot:409586-Rhodomonas_salina.1